MVETFTAIVTFYILFGLGNLFSHLIVCAGCRHNIMNVVSLGVEAGAQIFMWPMHLYAYYKDIRAGGVENQFKNVKVMTLKRLEGETQEQWQARAVKAIEEASKKK